jgi:phosphoglycolate phosphatase-like HAD superfamily hydrolase
MKTKKENNLPPVTSSSNFALEGTKKVASEVSHAKERGMKKPNSHELRGGGELLVPKNMPQEEGEEGTDNTTKVESVQTLKTTVNYEGNHNDPLRHEMAMPTTEEVITPLSQEETEIGVVTMENSAPVTNENLADTSLRKRTPQNPYKTTSSIRASGTSINHHQTSGESPSRD